MKNKKMIFIITILILICILAIGIYFYKLGNDNSNKTQIDTESTNIEVEYSKKELTGEWAEYKAKITLSDTKVVVEGAGVTTSGSTIKINSAGTYYITGTISDGSILIEAGSDDEVQLVLDNAVVISKSTAPINGVKAGKLTITLAENSINTITDTDNYTSFTDTEKSEPDGAIFTKTDLVINGTGKLVVNGNYLDGIVSKDTLKIINTNIEINSKDDGIRGKDYVAINNSNINITSGGDGIKSTNDTDENLGYVKIEGGTININSKADGIQAETILNISSDANINITTTGEVSSSSNKQESGYGPMGMPKQSSSTATTENSTSSKALKAGTEITIESGNIEITSTDDSVHSNGIIIINGGTIKASSGDDGIHADTNIVINDGNINITKSYEGIESSYIEINGGTINIVASDDGINVSGGNDSSSIDGRKGQNSFSNVENSNQKLVINNGNITVNATGDGLDANGSIYINGGNVLVEGPTSGGNGALDYDSECVVTGGNIIIYGSTGMWQNPTSNSTQYSLTFQLSGTSSDEVVLKDEIGNEITSFKTSKSYGAVTISNSKIEKGKTYTLYVNGTSKASLTANSIVTSNSSISGGMNNQGIGGPGGRR